MTIEGKVVLVTGANDPASAPVADNWRNSAAKALERQFAQLA
jgi:hypothetical protein